MADCTGLPTKEDAELFKQDAGTINEVVTSQDNYTSPASDGKQKKTLAGLAEDVDNIIYNVGFRNLGAFAVGVTVESVQDALMYNGELFNTDGPFDWTTDGATPDTDSRDWFNVTLQDRKTVSRSLNKMDSQTIYDTDTATAIPEYIYSPLQQKAYVVPSTAIGENIVSVIGSTLTTNNRTVKMSETLLDRSNSHANLENDMINGLPVTICVVGDSITAGNDVATPYPERLQEILRKWYSNNNIVVNNQGYAGQDSSTIISTYLDAIINVDADLYIIGIGVNDARPDRSISTEQYAKNLRVIYDSLSFAAVSFTSLTEVVQVSNYSTNNYGVDAYRRAMKSFALKNGERYIDLWSLMQKFLHNRGDVRGRINRDRLHYNQAGYDLIAECSFVKGFANNLVDVEPNQFIDGVGQLYRGDDLTLRVLNTHYSVSVRTGGGAGASTSTLFIFNSSGKPCSLIAHLETSTTTGATASASFTVNNTTTGFSAAHTSAIVNAPTAATGTEQPTAICSLASGLNIINFNTLSGEYVDIMGFTVREDDQADYMAREKASAANKVLDGFVSVGAQINAKSFRKLEINSVGAYEYTVGVDSDDYAVITQAVQLRPNAEGETRFRVRAHIGANTRVFFGSQSKASIEAEDYSSDYIPIFNMDIWGSDVYFKTMAISGTEILLAQVGGTFWGDSVIDIITSNAGTSFYINSTLIIALPTKLPDCAIYISTAENSAKATVIESVSVMGSGVAVGELVAGERWFNHQTNEYSIVNNLGVERKVSTT